MNKFITFTSLVAICFLSSCASLKKLGQDPNKTSDKKSSDELSKTTDLTTSTSDNNLNLEELNSASNSSGTNNQDQPQGRTIKGFLEPDVTGLPDNKDLQESNNVAPMPSPSNPGKELPVAPLVIDPNDSLPPTQ